MTTTTPRTAAAPAPASTGPTWMDMGKAVGVVTAATTAGALVLNNVSNWVLPGDFGAGVSDASNAKVVAASALVGTAGMVGYAVPKDDMGVKPGATVAGVASATALGYGVGNWFTGGWLEKGSVGMGLAGAAIAGGYSVLNRVRSGRSATATPRTGGRISGMWSAARTKLNTLSPRNRKIATGLGAGAATLAIAETSNILDWPAGGFNHVGALLSAGAVSAGVVLGGKAKDKYGSMTPRGKRTAKILGAVGAVAAIGGTYLAWKHGIIGGHGKSGDHSDKVPATNGNGSSTSTTATTAPATTATTAPTTAPATSAVPVTLPPATTVPTGSGGGTSFTLQQFSAAAKPSTLAKVQELQPTLSPAKANAIADKIISGQFETVSNPDNHDSLVSFFTTATQQQADSMFAHDVATLAAA